MNTIVFRDIARRICRVGLTCIAAYFCQANPCFAELIITNGSPPIDPNAYLAVANQARFDQAITLIQQEVVKGGALGAPHAFCSGTLVSPNIVLTAAHCIDDVLPNGIKFLMPKAGVAGKIGKHEYVFSGLLGPNVTSPQNFNIVDYVVSPDWVSETKQGTDLAVLLVGSGPMNTPITMYLRSGVAEPISFMPLYSGENELNQAFPDLGVPIGYGNTGDGLSGELSESSGTKRGCLVLMGTTLVNSKLEAKFLTRAELYDKKLPNNFLECQLGHGDSGGPIYQNIGTNKATVLTGVASQVHDYLLKAIYDYVYFQILGKPDGQPKNIYDASAYWTRVSPSVAFIDNSVQALGGTLPTHDPGQ